jgi:hypothetical protein
MKASIRVSGVPVEILVWCLSTINPQRYRYTIPLRTPVLLYYYWEGTELRPAVTLRTG